MRDGSYCPNDKTGIDPASSEEMRSFHSVFSTVHYWNFYALLVAVLIHIAGVVITELHEGW
jgi:cytochrome b